jgi:hypothetical protein
VDSVAGGGLLFNEINAHASKQVAVGDTRRSNDASESNLASIAVLESVVEEIVEFEEWMADPARPGQGVVVTVTGSDWTTKDAQFLQLHPEMLLTQVDAEEDALELMAAEQQLTEKDRIASAVAMLSDTPTDIQPVLFPANNVTVETTVGEENLRISLKAATMLGEEASVNWGSSSNQSPHSNADEDLQMTRDDEENESKDVFEAELGDDDAGEDQEEDGEEGDEEEGDDNLMSVVKSPETQPTSNSVFDETTAQESFLSGGEEELLTVTAESVVVEDDDDEAWMNDI